MERLSLAAQQIVSRTLAKMKRFMVNPMAHAKAYSDMLALQLNHIVS